MRTCCCGSIGKKGGFLSPGDYGKFLAEVLKKVVRGSLLEVEPDINYGPGQNVGGRWFVCGECKKPWRLVEPNHPFKGSVKGGVLYLIS